MRVCCALFVVALFAGCATTKPSPDLATAEVVDLTYAFDEHTLYWPNSPISFELKQQAYGMTPGGYFYASNTFCAPEHGGTHLDAPIHFSAQGRTIDQIPPRQLIGPAVVIDVTKQSAAPNAPGLSAAGRNGSMVSPSAGRAIPAMSKTRTTRDSRMRNKASTRALRSTCS